MREIKGKYYLTTGEAAQRLGVSSKTLIRWTERLDKTEALQKLVWFVDPTNERLRYFEQNSIDALRRMLGSVSGSSEAIGQRQVGDILILSPRGSFFGGRETDDLQDAFVLAAASGNKRLIVNLADCENVNSHTLGVLMHGYASYQKSGGQIRFCSPTKRVRDLFRITRVASIFDVDATEADSIAHLGGRAPSKSAPGAAKPTTKKR